MSAPALTLPFLELLDRIRSVLPGDAPVYLVGGAVRDALLSRITHDLDFALPAGGIKVGRRVANSLGGAFFPLDESRDTGRVILSKPGGLRQVLDFAAFRGPDLESDLRDRDFTINAMAVSVNNLEILIDPLNGASDLLEGSIRPCSPSTFLSDPIRILRCVRLAVDYDFSIPQETRKLVRQAIPQLPQVSPERVRDELFRILQGPSPTTAMRTLDYLGALSKILPDLEYIKDLHQPLPHATDAWNHSLKTLGKLNQVIKVLSPQHDPESGANWTMGLISLRLGRFRKQLQEHINVPINPDRSLTGLLLFAALYHDIGKSKTRQVGKDGRIRFIRHEQIGASITKERAEQLRLSNAETTHLVTIIRNHMRPLLLTQTGALPSRRAIYRFFRDCGTAGIDVCLLSLADILSTYMPSPPQDFWINQLDVVRALMEAWWERPEEYIYPPPLLTGNDLIQSFQLQPGPRIGQLLESIREAQASGELRCREDAFSYARLWLQNNV